MKLRGEAEAPAKAISPPPAKPEAVEPTAPEAVAPEFENITKQLISWSDVAKRLRKTDVAKAISELHSRQAARGTAYLKRGLKKRKGAWQSLEESVGGYKDSAVVPEITPPELTDAQWEMCAQKVLDLYPVDDASVQFKRTNTQAALRQLRLGKIPTNYEFELLEKVLGREATEKIARGLAGARRFSVWDVPRFIIQMMKSPFTLDVQFARQATSFAAAEPGMYVKGLKTAVKAYGSEKFTNEVLDNVENDPQHEDAVKHDVNFLSKAIYGERAEQFALGYQELLARMGEGRISKRLPPSLQKVVKRIFTPVRAYGKMMLASERAMVASVNEGFQGLWNKQTEIWSHEENITPEQLEMFKRSHAKNLNTFMKILRAKHPSAKELQRAANLVLFSPSMTFSRPLRIKALLANKGTRGKALVYITTEIAKIQLISTLVALVGNYWRQRNPDEEPPVDSDINPLSSEWGKIKVENTWYDFMGGDAQFYRTIARIGVGAYVQAESALTEKERLRVGLWTVRPPLETIMRYGKTRETAGIGFAKDLFSSTDFMGRPMPREEIIVRGFAPEMAQDLYDAMARDGVLQGLAAGAAATLSAGVQVYDVSPYKELIRRQEEISQQRFRKPWGDLRVEERDRLTPLLEKEELAVRQQRITEPRVSKYVSLEDIKLKQRMFQSLPEKIQDKLLSVGAEVGGIGRDWASRRLTKEQFKKYEELVISETKKTLREKLISSEYRKAKGITERYDLVTRYINQAKAEARKRLTKMIDEKKI